MESQPQNPEFRNNPENFHPCMYFSRTIFHTYGQAHEIMVLVACVKPLFKHA